jgi:hypothetical protein
MFAPSSRKLLVDLLSPPEGYALKHAIATTYTLDLSALAMVPLGFVGRDLSQSVNQIALLQTIREYSDRLDVFCQSGMVKVPHKSNQLLSFVEPVVHQVSRPSPGGLFHPKIWILRFGHVDSESGEPDLFRFICGSRNLTFDRSWDSFVALDGVETRRRHAYNNPLCRFLEDLPERTNGIPTERQSRLAKTISSLNNVEWEPPAGIANVDEWLKIHVFGKTRSKKPETYGRNIMVVSPFLSDEGIGQFDDCDALYVISRADQLNSLKDETKDWLSQPEPLIYVVKDNAALGDIDDDESFDLKWELSGLHAKLYAFERGRYTHVLIGSANATEQGWSTNDEVLVELVGKSADFGIQTMVGAESDFQTLLIDHTFGESEEIEEKEELRWVLEQSLLELSAHQFRAVISGSDGGQWVESVKTSQPIFLTEPNSELRISLLTDKVASRLLTDGVAIEEAWQLSGVEASTPFLVLTLSKNSVSVSTVVVAELTGGPNDRLDRIFAHHISKPELFLQLVLLFLNGSDDQSSLTSRDLFFDEGSGSTSWMNSGSGLLEQLLTALSRSPESIDKIGEMVTRLQATVEGRKVLPTGWEELWASVKDAKALMESHRD